MRSSEEPYGVDAGAASAAGSARSRTFADRLLLLWPAERRPVGWCTAYFFFLLAANSVLKPVREAAGLKEGVEHLPRTLTITLAAMSLAIPAYNLAISRLPRARVAVTVHRATQLGLVLFMLSGLATGRWGKGFYGVAFFAWFSVFNLVGVAALRTLMADVWRERQATRLFGLISVGGTLGIVFGAALARWLARSGSLWWLFALSIVQLEAAIFCQRRVLAAWAPSPAQAGAAQRTPGSVLTALRSVAAVPFLRKVATFVALTSACTMLLYFEQARIVDREFPTRAAKVEAFATIDLVAACATVVMELFVAGRFIRAFGARAGLFILPLGACLSFGALRVAPSFAILVAVQTAVRALNYGLATPARESLFADLAPETKYRGKSITDTLAWRGGDLLGTWAPSLAALAGLSATSVALMLGLLLGASALAFEAESFRTAERTDEGA